ncbi:MAG: PAS domain S-box protein [Acidobacteriota bacterium]
MRTPRPASLERLPWFVRALLGCVIAVIASTVTYTIPPLRAFPLLLGFPCVILAAWFFGMWGGSLCALTEAILVNSFLTRTELRFSLGNAPQVIRLSLSILLAWVIRRSAQQRADLYIKHWQERFTRANIERELAEERARNSDDVRETAKRLGELAAIVDSSDDVILSKNLDSTITSWNAAATRLFGYTADEMIGNSILRIIPPHLQSEEPEILRTIRAGRSIEHFETTRVTKDGRTLDVSVTISPIKDAQGNIIGASKILRDISGRRRIEQSLVQAEKIAATGRMAATIAHEINNPLEAVVNLLYLLHHHVHDPEGMQFLQAAESELARVSHIAKQTLGYYREHAAAVTASVSDVVQHAITIYEPRCAAAGIAIHKSLHSTRKITLRRGEMMQIISNLIVNSIYAMPDGGTLNISVDNTAAPADGILLTIADNGVGIARQNLPHVFEAFFTTRTTVGTGIGLFVARQFIEGHGGSIEIASTTDSANHGTTVTIFLPLTTPYDATPAQPEAEAISA